MKAQRKRARSPEPVPVLPTQLLGFNICRLAHLKRTRDDGLFKSGLGIGLNQFGLLILLDAHPGLGGGQLARVLMITPQSIAPLLSGLERLALIRRVGARRRGVRVGAHLTRKGQRLLQRGRRILARTERETRDHLSADEAKRFNDILIRLAAVYVDLARSEATAYAARRAKTGRSGTRTAVKTAAAS
jgi:DNA-binding MarR family transcriptional regulator